MSDTPHPYKLIPACGADKEFLWGLHCETMQKTIDATWGWDEGWQREDLDRRLAVSSVYVIVSEGRSVGAIFIEEFPDYIWIQQLQILPEMQRRGLGTAVLRQLIEESTSRALDIALAVAPVNIHAMRLYRLLGFDEIEGKPPLIWMRRYRQKEPPK